jgi:hypothetical protein
MNFKDESIEKLNLDKVDDIVYMITHYLCGEDYFCGREHYKKLIQSKEFKKDKELLGILLRNAKEKNLNYQQFNELLLLLNQDRVSEDFFLFFFTENETILKDLDIPLETLTISLNDLKNGVIKFRGYAMLCFGNFRFAYKQLIRRNSSELKEVVNKYMRKKTEQLLNGFKSRPEKMLETWFIDIDETWYIGRITSDRVKNEKKLLNNRNFVEKYNRSELSQLRKMYRKIENTIIDVEKRALRNTNVYLTWDYMDIYLATSMRNKWEFQESYDFIQKVFEKSRKIKNLKLRYFDPTQSKCDDRIDKGLIEGLMLKRVKCCIYMSQETDTMGKDSELAATLAQGKPVIAYIPEIDISKH